MVFQKKILFLSDSKDLCKYLEKIKTTTIFGIYQNTWCTLGLYKLFMFKHNNEQTDTHKTLSKCTENI